MMLREVLLKEDLHHMMSIDDGNFPGDDIIPMSQLFTEEEKERNPAVKRKPGRVRLPGMRFPPTTPAAGKNNAASNKANGGGNKKTMTRGALSPPKKAVVAGRPSFNSLFRRQKAKQAKVKATEKSIEKIIKLVATGDGDQSTKVEGETEQSETTKRGEKPGSRGEIQGYDESDFPDGESEISVKNVMDDVMEDEYEVKMSNSLKPNGDNRRSEYPPPPPYPTRLPSSGEPPATLPNLFDADWLLQMEQAVGETAAHLTPDPMSYLRSGSIFQVSDWF